MAFTMEVSNTELIKQEIIEQVKPEPEEVKKLREQAQTNALAIINMDLESLDKRREFSQSIDKYGLDSLQRSSNKNALLQVTVGKLSKEGEEGGTVSRSLMDLNREIKNLDPSMTDFTKTGILGKLFNPVRGYFDKYQKADTVIADIVDSLERGKSTLKNDNTTLEIEQQSLRELTKKITQEIQMGSMMDEYIEYQLQVAKASDEGLDTERENFIKEEILFPLRQRVMDMQQMIVVNHQGIMAIEVIRRNNKELIRGVDRAKNVTVSALRTAVIVASALYNQQIVLKKINMLNQTTAELISGTSKALRQQGTEIHKQSIESNLSPELLKESFEDVLAALDEISAYKQEALPIMKDTITQFRELAARGEEQISKMERGNILNASETTAPRKLKG